MHPKQNTEPLRARKNIMAEVRPYYVRYWYMKNGEAHEASQREEAFTAEDAAYQVSLQLSLAYQGHKILGVDPIREG